MSSYQTSKKKLSKPSWKQDLKISLATSEDLGHSQTWRMTRGRKNKNQGDLFEPIVNHSIQHVWLEHPVPDKLFFLATGEGCGTVEVKSNQPFCVFDLSCFFLIWVCPSTTFLRIRISYDPQDLNSRNLF